MPTDTIYYCSFCPAELPTAEAAQAHLVEAHTGIYDWLRERLGGDLLPIGAQIWYWWQDQDPTQEGWRPAILTGWGGKDGQPTADIETTAGDYRWGWAWQVLPRTPDAQPPAQPPAELTGGRP